MRIPAIKDATKLAAVVCFLAATVTAMAGPLAHSHNDYEQARPLHDALAQGFDSIEADVWLVDGRLLVAHERSQVHATRTLEALYLDPLRAHLSHNTTRPLILLIDVKTEAGITWAALDEVLERYSDLSGRVQFVISGNRAREVLAGQSQLRAAMDGRIEDLAGSAPAERIPLISDNWEKYFTWRGEGEFPVAEQERLKGFVTRAHAQQRMLRFWNTPDRPAVWRVLRETGVDVIGTDNLAGLRRLLDSP